MQVSRKYEISVEKIKGLTQGGAKLLKQISRFKILLYCSHLEELATKKHREYFLSMQVPRTYAISVQKMHSPWAWDEQIGNTAAILLAFRGACNKGIKKCIFKYVGPRKYAISVQKCTHLTRSRAAGVDEQIGKTEEHLPGQLYTGSGALVPTLINYINI